MLGSAITRLSDLRNSLTKRNRSPSGEMSKLRRRMGDPNRRSAGGAWQARGSLEGWTVRLSSDYSVKRWLKLTMLSREVAEASGIRGWRLRGSLISLIVSSNLEV